MKTRSICLAALMIITMIVPAMADFSVRTSDREELEPRVAYNATDEEYFVVWIEFDRIWGKRLNEDGTKIGDAFKIFDAGRSPRVAYNPVSNNYLVICVNDGIKGKIVTGSTVSATEENLAVNGSCPEIAYNSKAREYLICYYRANVTPPRLYSRRITSGGAIAANPQDVEITNDSTFALAYAPIGSGSMANGKFIVTEDPARYTILDSEGKKVDDYFIDPQPSSDGSGPGNSQSPIRDYYDEGHVDVAYGQISKYTFPVFAIVWGDRDNIFQLPSGGTGVVIGAWCAFINANDHSSANDVFFDAEPVDDGSYWRVYSDGLLPRIDYCAAAEQFVVAWREFPTSTNGHIRGTPLLTSGSDAVLSRTNGDEYPAKPAIAASSKSASALVVWEDSRDQGTKLTDIYGNILDVPQGSLTLTSPNGGEVWASGSVQNITWNSANLNGFVLITYSIDGYAPASWQVIENSTPNDGVYEWTVPDVSSTNCVVKIAATNDPTNINDWSDAVFTITSTSASGCTFTGGAYEGDPTDMSTPISDITVTLFGDTDSDPENGTETQIDQATTDASGLFSLYCPAASLSHTYYHIVETDKGTHYSTGVEVSTPGVVTNENCVSYTGADLTDGTTYSDIRFWDKPTGLSPCTFTGNVYKGDPTDTSTPIPDVTVTLFGDTDSDPENGTETQIDQTTTDASGQFSLNCPSASLSHTYYHIVETDKATYISTGAEVPTPGVVFNENCVSYTGADLTDGTTYSDIRFWDKSTGLSPCIFTGHVYEGNKFETGMPLSGVDVNLVGDDNDNPHDGHVMPPIDICTTDGSGEFSLTADELHDFYHIMEHDPADYVSTGAEAPLPGSVTDFNIVTYSKLDLTPGATYTDIDFWDLPTTSVNTKGIIPDHFNLHQNHPNPFNPSTEITFSLPMRSRITLEIYTVQGKRIRTLATCIEEAGTHTRTWDGTDDRGRLVQSGLYLCRMKASAYQKTIRMLFLK